MGDNITDTNKRFEIFVPNPKARINLGASNTTTTGPFGYTGLSLQSDVHLFIDVNKNTLYQTGSSFCGQVGSKWMQYSNSDMFVSCTSNMNVSANKKIVIASGAGQGQITAKDHGPFPRLVGYNNLGLHYAVDKIQVGLFEFFHGRRTRDEYGPKMKAVLSAGGAPTTYFDGAGEAGELLQEDEDLQFGFMELGPISLRELYPVASERSTLDYSEEVEEEGDPVSILDPFYHKKIISEWTSDTLKWGFSSYFKRFDPYAKTDKSTISHPIAKGLVGFLNMIKSMVRFSDVCLKYAELITDNFLVKRAQAAMGAAGSLLGAMTSAYVVVEPTIQCFENGPDAWYNKFADEGVSGWGARFGGGSPVKAGSDAAGGIRNQQATIQSDRGPWDLSDHAPSHWEMKIEWDGGGSGKEQTISLDSSSGSPTPATIEVEAGTFAAAQPAALTFRAEGFASGETGLLDLEVNGTTYHTTFSHADSSTVERIKNRIAAACSGVTVTRSGSEITVETTTAGANQSIRVAGNEAHDASGQGVTRLHCPEGTEVAGADAESGKVIFWINSSDVVTLSLDSTNADTASNLQATLAASLTQCSVTGSGPITITTSAQGSSASIEVLHSDGTNTSDDAALDKLGLSVGDSDQGTDPPGPVSLSNVTAADIVARITGSGVSPEDVGGTVQIKSKKKGNGSEIKVSGNLADEIFSDKHDKIEGSDTSGWDQGRAASKAFYGNLLSWNHELQKLPEDTRNLTRPIREAVSDVVSTFSALESAVENVMDFVGGPLKGLPSPPQAIGLIANDGISLGTQDRIVGSGGKGIIFVADGGSGDEDHNKFIPKVEQFVNLALTWDCIDKALEKHLEKKGWIKKEKARPKSLGFRVLSDSTVDLLGTNAAQLLALGRGKLTAKGPDDKQFVGVGVARVAGSYAAELAGYRKVVISARNPGKAGDADGTTGGRVEVAGQTIAIGGMNLDGDVEDFKDAEGFGIEPLKVESFAGAEHLEPEELATLKKDVAAYCWPETLRKGGDKGHPNTKHVMVHAEKDTVIVVGPYMVQVSAEEGVTVGQRKPKDDPAVNEINDELPRIWLDEESAYLHGPGKDGDGPWLELKEGKAVLTGCSKSADSSQLLLQDNKAKLWAKDQFVQVEGSGTVTLKAKEIKAAGTSVKVEGQTIKLG